MAEPWSEGPTGRRRRLLINDWSYSKIKKIKVLDFFFNFRDIVWKGKTITVEYDLFTGMTKRWMESDNLTKQEALDLAFSMY